ncbi:MAG: hypothetical protein K0S14_3723 [Thermomicrobiales bacterium]|nr:hypothetical protein [Thermomicrobiales bacterium]
MIIIDEAVAIIMNQNLTQSAFTTNREFGVVTNHAVGIHDEPGVRRRDQPA